MKCRKFYGSFSGRIGKYAIGDRCRARKALAPCPKCGSWNTIVENGIFVCYDCGFEGG